MSNARRFKKTYRVVIDRPKLGGGTLLMDWLSPALHSRYQLIKALARYRRSEPDAYGAICTRYR